MKKNLNLILTLIFMVSFILVCHSCKKSEEVKEDKTLLEQPTDTVKVENDTVKNVVDSITIEPSGSVKVSKR